MTKTLMLRNNMTYFCTAYVIFFSKILLICRRNSYTSGMAWGWVNHFLFFFPYSNHVYPMLTEYTQLKKNWDILSQRSRTLPLTKCVMCTLNICYRMCKSKIYFRFWGFFQLLSLNTQGLWNQIKLLLKYCRLDSI